MHDTHFNYRTYDRKDPPVEFYPQPTLRQELERSQGSSLFSNTPISNMQTSQSKLHDLYRRHKQQRGYTLD